MIAFKPVTTSMTFSSTFCGNFLSSTFHLHYSLFLFSLIYFKLQYMHECIYSKKQHLGFSLWHQLVPNWPCSNLTCKKFAFYRLNCCFIINAITILKGVYISDKHQVTHQVPNENHITQVKQANRTSHTSQNLQIDQD